MLTLTESSLHARHCRGMTLVETLVAVVVGIMILGVVLSVSLFASRSLASVYNYTVMEMQSRNAHDHLTQTIRRVTAVVSPSGGTTTAAKFKFEDFDGVTKDVEYRFVPKGDPSGNEERLIETVWEATGKTERILLEGCTAFKLDLLDAAGKTPGPFGSVKIVRFSWDCSRRLINIQNTAKIETVEVHIRN